MPQGEGSGQIQGNLVTAVDVETLNRLRLELAEVHENLAKCKSDTYSLECENTDLKFRMKELEAELTETRVLLGQTMVAANRNRNNTSATSVVSVPGTPRREERPLKRARSPSLELIGSWEPPKKKGKEKASTRSSTTPESRATTVADTPPPSDIKVEPSTCPGIIEIEDGRTEEAAQKDSSESDLFPKNNTSTQEDDNPTTEEEVPSGANNDAPSPGPSRHTAASTEVLISTQPISLPVTCAVTNSAEPVLLNHQTLPEPLTIEPPALVTEVPRTFLRVAYGGSDQQFLQYIQKEMNPSGPVLRRLVFPMLDLNPTMPSKPGEHGFVFNSRREILANSPWTLFCKHNKSRAVWQYLGEYENVVCGQVEPESFAAQNMEVKLTWAKALLKSKGAVNNVNIQMRARIALRKYGVIPVEDEKAEEEIIEAEFQAIKAEKGRELSPDDVISAICNGDERIDLIRMTCVKYDHVFANDIAEKFPNYDALLAASKEKQQIKKAKSNSGTQIRSQKRKEVSQPEASFSSSSGIMQQENVSTGPIQDGINPASSIQHSQKPRCESAARRDYSSMVSGSDDLLSEYLNFLE